MAFKIYNTMSRAKEEFHPLEKGVVKMYACGPTVYNFAHIGNLKTYVFEDVLRRYLEFKGFKVMQAMNLTDVDDKTIRDSRKKGIPLREFTDEYIKAYFEDRRTLNLEEPEVWCRATDYIPEMVALVKKLLDKGFAYKSEDESIYFSIKKFPSYGKLSRVSIKGLKAGARVRTDEYEKENVSDFVLWKAWDEEDGDVFWETELGKGRPGWHLECSAMSLKELGESFDIHCGAIDLIFPHHENEIAQSEAATGKPFARYWVHGAHLMVDGKKMAKRFNNFYTLRDLLAKGFKPAGIRYFLLSSHYRMPQNLTFEALQGSQKTVEGIFNFVNRLREYEGGTESREASAAVERMKNEFEQAMDDDLNAPQALAAFFEMQRALNKLMEEKAMSKQDADNALQAINRIDSVLGLLRFMEPATPPIPREEIDELIAKREEAKARKDYKTADAVRARLNKLGVIVEDTSSGPKWRLA
ncbi:MAG: cysteine--tRNA ligase [Candidatus Micrarchaeia archaeon]